MLEGLTFHSDLEGWKVGGGSIPPEIVVTSQRPDLVILDKRKTQTEIHLVELTVPFDTVEGIERARERKSERYAALASNISEQGLKCHLHTLEIGTRGYISPRNRRTITHLCKIAGERKVKEVNKPSWGARQSATPGTAQTGAEGILCTHTSDSSSVTSIISNSQHTIRLKPCSDGNASTDLGDFLPCLARI